MWMEQVDGWDGIIPHKMLQLLEPSWGANNSWNNTYGWKEENLGFKNGRGSFKERHLVHKVLILV